VGSTKALIVGISNYNIEGATDLPFCKNDILAIEAALHNGLKIPRNNIITYGNFGEVNKEDFIKEILSLSKEIQEDDVLIFYFSGHGKTYDDKHYLVFSDGLIHTQEIIDLMEKINAKSKLIILDCCFSGNFRVSGTSKFNISETVEEFSGKGYAVISSSNSSQVSRSHPKKSVSLFTHFLSRALQSNFIIREGKISLHEIHKLVSFYLDLWNKKNPDNNQQPIFRANMGGTIYFEVEDYEPYCIKKVYHEYDKYIIYDVEPLHTGSSKRFSAKVILKKPLSIKELSEASSEIIDELKQVEVYQNDISERQWKGKLANIIWIFFGYDENDMINNNYLCRITWVDSSQDKNYWYRINKNDFIMNGIHFSVFSCYESTKAFIDEYSEDREKIILKTREIRSHMIGLAEEIIYNYNEYKNKEISEQDFIEIMNTISAKVDKYHTLSRYLGIAQDELHDWVEAHISMFDLIHNFTLYYNENGIKNRTKKNRINCMDMTIKYYYSDLEKIRKIEQNIF
jgi:hypothetical protein